MDQPRSPLDEGEIEDDDESKEFDDGYDENLMGDEEDRKMLASLTEKERELILYNRSERRETLRIRFGIAQKLKSKKRQSKQVRARKRLRASEIYSSDESSEESDEYTPETNKTSGLNDMNSSSKQTNKMNNRSSALLITSSSSSSSSESSASSSSSSSESEQENDGLEADDDGETVRDNFQMTLVELKALQIRRDGLERWVYSPFFNETVIGLFVKISVGNNSHTMEHQYKVAQIVDVTRGNLIYGINVDKKTKTDKQCVVRIGNVEKAYQMSFVSNRFFDEDDYNKWKDQLQRDEQDMPSREHFIKKQKDLYRAKNFVYKDEDIAYEVNERSRFNDNPYNFALRKTELMGQKADAEASNDYEKARQIQQIIDELEEKTRQLEKTRSSSTFSAISIVNERNRYKNIVDSERVLRESVKTEDGPNPFRRRKCAPTIVHNMNKSDLEAQTGDKNDQDESKQSANNTNNGKPSKVESVKSVGDLFQAHASIDLELDIDI